MKNLLYLIAICFCFSLSQETNAQSFDQAIGARLGYPFAVSYKKFISESDAIEAYAGNRGYVDYRRLNASIAYQRHSPFDAPGLEWYWGAGASAYLYSFNVFNDNGNLGIGLQGYLGLQYTFEDIPLSITLDWVPTVFLTGYDNGAGFEYGSLAVRYLLD